MKDYLNLAIRVNIAVLLGLEVVAAIVLPIVLMLVLSTGIVSATADPITTGIWIGIITNAIIIFIASFWVFKMTYGNMRETGKQINLINSIIYSIVLFIIVNIGLSFFLQRGGYIGIAIGTTVALIAFYLAGRSAEKKNKQKNISQAPIK